MTHEQQALWQRIRDFQIDVPTASYPFSTRLAREQGWTPAFTKRVIDEYRRFAFLSVAAGHGVSPSKAVDEAWHLHLLYTRNYWDEFCRQALGRPLHHSPADGNAEDEAKYEGWYDNTLSSYRHLFGEEPPADIWPSATATRKSGRKWWLLLCLFAISVSGCDRPVSPLDWNGPEFLQLFAVLYILGIAAALILRHFLRGTPEGPPAAEWRLHVYEQAYLNEGETLALATALAHLASLKRLKVEPKSGRMRACGDPPADAHRLDREILKAAVPTTGASYDSILRRTKPILAEIETSLRRQRLWADAKATVGSTIPPFLIASLPLLLGVAKIGVGFSRDRPVGFLIVGCLTGGLLNLFFLSKPKRSRYGDRVLNELQERQSGGASVRRRRGSAPGELALGMALFGLTALNTSAYAHLRPAITPSTSTTMGDSGGSSCGSSSCGGGGGGCGGCGGGD